MKTKNCLLLVIALLCNSILFSQKIYLPKEVHNKKASIPKVMKKISKIVLEKDKKDSTTFYYNSIFQIQLLAEKYKNAETSIDKYIDGYTINKLRTGRMFLYKVFAKAGQLSKKESIPFNEAYKKSFTNSYINLKDVLKPEVTRSVNNDTKTSDLEERFHKSLKEYKDKDSLSIGQAKSLCNAFSKFYIYSKVGQLAHKLLDEEDKKIFDIRRNVLIKTGNGGEVTALLIRKKGTKRKLPAIFVYNIYAGSYDYEVAKRAAVNGYVGVAVNTRGKRLSKNEILPFEFDGKDSYKTIDWISKHKWCNGDVGMMGGSYLGFSQWSATKNLHPALKTIVPQVSVGIGIDYPMQNNVFMSYMLQWINYVRNNKFTDENVFASSDYEKAYDEYYLKGLSFNKLDSILNKGENKIFQKWLQHPGYDSFWQNMVPYKNEFKNINIPVLSTTGYYDADQIGALYYFNQHYKHNPKANHYLVIGPYSHGGGQHYPSKVLMGYTIDKAALISIHELAYQWFDYILKNKKKPELLKDKINYQVMGANSWKHCSSFGNMNSNTFKFYLSNITDGQNFKLKTSKPSHEGSISYEIDLSKRSKNDSHGFFSGTIKGEEINSENAISFITEPFNEDVSVNGTFGGELNLAINKKDLDVFIKLYEILPDGSYFFLSEYLSRASYAKDNENRELLEPFKNYKFPIKQSFMTSRKIAKGSKLLVIFGVNKSKYWEINYGTGKTVSTETIKDAGEPLLVKLINNSYISVGYNKEEK
ncbi:CocE/NonD family hydrolase [Tenacibaculum xiamenense]|uniref:CocE/NonD family hydrolase n=1 Tax=Tenacibaculum xiamenense TaxID=1261553 RepID=UPI003892CDE9